MFKLLFDASMIYDIVLLVILGIIVIACFKSSWGKYVFFSVVSIILIASGVYSFLNVNNYLNASGGIWGTIVGDFSVNKAKISDLKFDLQYIELTQTGNSDENIYSAKLETNATVSIDNVRYYGCYVNDIPVEIEEFSSEYLIANFTYNFYDYDNNLIISDTLKLRFSFFSNYTIFVLQTEGGSTAVKNWNNYFKNNNFVVSLKLLDNPLEVESYLEQFSINVNFVLKYEDYPNDDILISIFLKSPTCLSDLGNEIKSSKYLYPVGEIDSNPFPDLGTPVDDIVYVAVQPKFFYVEDEKIDINTYIFKENTVVIVECSRTSAGSSTGSSGGSLA